MDPLYNGAASGGNGARWNTPPSERRGYKKLTF